MIILDKVECFAKRVREKMGAAVPSDVPRDASENTIKKENNHIYENIRNNFIDGFQITRRDVKGVYVKPKFSQKAFEN